MVYGASSFIQELGGWNTSKVTAMEYMFYGASSFTSDLGGWNVEKVTTMDAMFQNASSFVGDICTWGPTRPSSPSFSFGECTICPMGSYSNSGYHGTDVPTGVVPDTTGIRLQTAAGAPSFDSTGTIEGRLEIYVAGDWASVCETEGFEGGGEAESTVACRQLANELGYTLVSASKVGREVTDDRCVSARKKKVSLLAR